MTILSALYLREAVDNIVIGLRGLKDANGDIAIGKVQRYLYPYPTTPNWACIHMFGSSVAEQRDSSRRSNQLWTIFIRVGIGNLNQGFEGRQQERMYEIVPLVMNTILEHPDLTFTGATTKPTYYLPGTVEITSPPRTGVDDLRESGKFLYTEFGITMAFNVQLKPDRP
ncbi:MAG: hypothetical protein GTO60_16710 [Gammaproteobacteria bacterium]|nr:hypothetical protein [Gammaproteobacteria bacterium]